MGSRQAQALSVGVRKLEVQFGSRIVSDITPKEVDAWTKNLPLASRSKINTVKIGRQVFGLATKQGYTKVNPFTAVHIFDEDPTEENGKIYILSADETSQLLHATISR